MLPMSKMKLNTLATVVIFYIISISSCFYVMSNERSKGLDVFEVSRSHL